MNRKCKTCKETKDKKLFFKETYTCQTCKKRKRSRSVVNKRVEEFFQIPGIYFLKWRGEIVYIGESKCVVTRVTQHFSENKKIFDSFSYTKMNKNKSERRDKEKELIQKYNPRYNIEHN